MWSKRLTRTVMAGMAVLVWSTSVAAQECSRLPAKIAAFETAPGSLALYLLCDRAKAPACAVTFSCSSTSSLPGHEVLPDEGSVTWDMTVEPDKVFRYSRGQLGMYYQSYTQPPGPAAS